jgi:Uncharacterised protein family UPF0547
VSDEQGQSSGPVDPVPAATGDERAMKACPDCAELVLEAARKCRYCGYRFDGQPASRESQEGLFAHLFRRAPRQLTMAETLEQLGVELDPDERPVGLWLGQVQGVDGYVALTDARLFFVMGLRHQKAATTAPWQHRLDELAGAEITTHRWKATLVLHWVDSPELSIDGLARNDLHRLHSALLDRVPS